MTGEWTTGGTTVELAEVARLERERDGLVERLAAANRHLAEAERRYDEAAGALAAEQADVRRLEQLSVTRILAGLRGSRDADLDRERAEEQAAEYAAAEAAARRDAAREEVDHLVGRLAALGDLDARREELLVRREAEVAADPRSGPTRDRLAELAGRQGVLEAEATQLDEALAAADAARRSLDEAARHLGSAGSWATYDTFLGGGMVGDLMKHQRLDRAGDLMRHADAALRHLATELADVEVGAVGEVGVTELARTFDVWFDNVFSDWAVRERIRQAAARVAHLLRGVDEVGADLVRRRAGVGAALAEVEEGRRALLSS
ncbi:hypothetical protein [Nocardioides solisilvae]|uniref:hypothetical protein n=1 Tax=Nocardioides solisilvae TaxID=1542435 RepID=UPI000D750DB0|nr:hypothetical protein [Nocardioides solisilvae]